MHFSNGTKGGWMNGKNVVAWLRFLRHTETISQNGLWNPGRRMMMMPKDVYLYCILGSIASIANQSMVSVSTFQHK